MTERLEFSYHRMGWDKLLIHPSTIVIRTRMIRCLPEAQVESLQIERAELCRSKFNFALNWMIGTPARVRTYLLRKGTRGVTFDEKLPTLVEYRY